MARFAAPAKLNLYLRIVGRREDGYHEIETLFQRIGLSDELVLEEGEPGRTEPLLCVEGPFAARVPEGPENLVLRAWGLVTRERPAERPAPRVTLHKLIPPGSGLGGGSSDGAAALRAFCKYLDREADPEALGAMALELGSDLPFFLGPPAAVGRGRGERLEPALHGAPLHVALALPPFPVSTTQAYRLYDPRRALAPPHGVEHVVERLRHGDTEGTLAALFNEMETLSFPLQPKLGLLRDRLANLAGRSVRMSGSGSALYTVCATSEEADRVAEAWRAGEREVAVRCAPFLLEDVERHPW